MAIILPGQWELDVFAGVPVLTIDIPPPGYQFTGGVEYRIIASIPPGTKVTTEDFEFYSIVEFWTDAASKVDSAVRQIKKEVEERGSTVYAYSLWRQEQSEVRVPEKWCVPSSVLGVPVPFVGGKCIPIPVVGGGQVGRMDKWRLKVLHSQIPLATFIGIAILILTSLIFIWGVQHLQSVPEEIDKISQDIANVFSKPIQAATAGVTQALILFAVAGAIFSIAVYMALRGAGAPVRPPAPPRIPGLVTPAPTIRVGAGPRGRSVTAGVGTRR